MAIDAATGDILRDKKFDQMVIGAAAVVNDFVFTSTFDDKIYVLDRKTGSEVWTFQAPGGINGWPAISGNTIIFPVGVGLNPVLIAFKIGADIPETVTPQTLPLGWKGQRVFTMNTC